MYDTHNQKKSRKDKAKGERDRRGKNGRLKKAIRETEKELRKERSRDEECRRVKREVREVLREWERRVGVGEEYKKRLEYKRLCEKTNEENDRWEKEAAKVRRETEVLEILNKEKKKKKRIKEGIEREKWREYYMRSLGGWRTE